MSSSDICHLDMIFQIAKKVHFLTYSKI